MTSRPGKETPGKPADSPRRKPGRPKKPDPRNVTRILAESPAPPPEAPVPMPAPSAPPSTPAQQLPGANARCRQWGVLAEPGQRRCAGIRPIPSPRSLIPFAPCARAAAPGQIYCEKCLRDYHHQIALKAVLPPDWHARMESAARGVEDLATPHQDGFARVERKDAARSLDAGRRRLLAARALAAERFKRP